MGPAGAVSRKPWRAQTVAKRLPIYADVEVGAADPANGERVLRCKTCGMPGSIVFIVGSRGGVPGRYPVCDRCWFSVNSPDPLTTDGASQ